MSKKKTVGQATVKKRTRKKIEDSLKVKIVLEALKESMTLNELGAKYEVHPNQIVTWKRGFWNDQSMFSPVVAKNCDCRSDSIILLPF